MQRNSSCDLASMEIVSASFSSEIDGSSSKEGHEEAIEWPSGMYEESGDCASSFSDGTGPVDLRDKPIE